MQTRGHQEPVASGCRKYSHSEVYRSRAKGVWGSGYNGEDQKRFSTVGTAQAGVLSSSGQYEWEDGQWDEGGWLGFCHLERFHSDPNMPEHELGGNPDGPSMPGWGED